MPSIDLVHIAFAGASRDAAVVDFGDALTLVRGPSDTGKSFLVGAIDFMLGASRLQDLPEMAGYESVLMGLRLDDGDFTLVRGVSGGRFFLYDELHTVVPSNLEPRVLSQQHNAANDDNLSAWLLGHLGLTGMRLRKNARNETVSLSFRDLAHLAIVDETKIQAEEPPVYSGVTTSRTKDVSVLKLLLEGQDDSGLPAVPDAGEVRRLKGAKLEVVDLLIQRAQQEAGEASSDDLRDQLARVSTAIDRGQGADQHLRDRRIAVQESLSREATRLRAIGLRRAEIETLNARFGLLREQYELDVQRLEAIIEGGSVLGFFSTGDCPLCGAAIEHQRHTVIEVDPEGLVASARAEQVSTQRRLADLELTFQDFALQMANLDTQRATTEARQMIQADELRQLDAHSQSDRDELRTLIDKRSELEGGLSALARLRDLERLRLEIEGESTAEARAQATAIPMPVINEFSDAIARRLQRWGYPDTDVRYDRVQQDIYAGLQFRGDHGKGVRAVLHAAFTVGLADYCFERGLPHPGFVILDSPVVTYRPPDAEADDPERRTDLATRMYMDLATSFDGQVIIMENTDPSAELPSRVSEVVFSKAVDHGRYGFFSGPVEVS